MSAKVLFEALKAGNKLKNSNVWKNRATALDAVTPLVLALGTWAYSKGYLPEGFTTEDLIGVASVIVTLGMWISGYLHQATSTKVGIGTPPDEYHVSGEVEPGLLQRDTGLWKAVQLGETLEPHPGDDPGLDSFNRGR